MASDFRWLHFSDLHFGYYDNRADIQDLREKLVRSIRTIGEKFSDIKYVFITGDIAYKGQYSSSANHSMKTLMEEFEKLGIKGECVFWCCGNHDIVRDVMYRTLTIGARSRKESYEEAMNDPKAREQLTKNKFENYLKKHQEYIGRTANPNLQDVSQAHFFYALDDLNLIVLNTCIASCDDEDEQQLYIVDGKLYELFKNIDPQKPTFVIGHHGIKFFNQEEQKKLGELFDDSKVDYYLCGHSHLLSCYTLPDLSTDIREFTAGGMILDNHAQTVFYLGHYSTIKHGVHLTPYVYKKSGRFAQDFDFNRAFSENRWYKIERFREPLEEMKVEPVSFAAAREEAQKYYNILRNEHGRLAGIYVDDDIIPNAVPYFDTFVSTDTAEQIKLLDIVKEDLKDVKGIILTGEGGSGKTTALLRLWEDELKRNEYVPVFMPLNEYNSLKEIDNFIELYLNDIYHINIKSAPYKILMLLDGFNEITVQQEKAREEIKTLLVQYGAKLKIIITSRSEQDLSPLLTVMSHYVLMPLEEAAVLGYLKKVNVLAEQKVLTVLTTPMMLTLYTSTCFIENEIRRKLSLTFMTADSKAAIIYNYLLCQLGKLSLDGQKAELLSAYSYIFFVAPFVAYHMEESGRFNIKRENLLLLDRECKAVFTEKYITELAISILGDVVTHGQRVVNVYEMLVYRQYMLMEEERKYFFRHQYFRDFLSAWNIVNYIRKDIEDGINLLIKRRLPENILEMIIGMNTTAGEEWECVLEKLCDRRYKETGNAVNNLIAILEGFQKKKGFQELDLGNGIKSRYYPPLADKFCGLDFTSVSLYGRNCSGYKQTNFSRCIFSKGNFVSEGHHSSVTCVEYGVDRDGNRIALTASLDGSVKEWNLKTGRCIKTYFAGADITSVTYTKNNEFILATSMDNAVYRFASCINGNLITGSSEDFKYMGHKKSVKSIDICSDGRYFITASDDGIICEWDNESKEIVKEFVGSISGIRSIRYGGDNRYIVSGAQNGEVRIWDRELGYTIFQFRAHKKAIMDIRISPDGTCFLTASSDNLVKEWKFIFSREGFIQGVEEEPIKLFRGHVEAVTSVHYNRSGNRILTSSSDSKIILWDYQSKKILKKYTRHSNRVNWAVFSPNEEKILSSAHNGEILETDIESGEVLIDICGVDDRYNCMIKMSDRTVIAGGNDGTLREWDVIDGRCVRIFPGHQGAIRCIANYGNIIYSCGTDRMLYAWSYKDGLVKKMVCLAAAPRSMDLSEDGERLILGLDDYSIIEFDTFDLKAKKTYSGVVRFVEGLKYLHGCKKFVSITKDRTLRMWHSEVDMCEIIYECKGTPHLSALQYDYKRNCIYISEGKDILALDADTYVEKHRFEGRSGKVGFINIDSERGTMLAGVSDGMVQEWDLDNYSNIKSYVGHKGRISGAVYCGDKIITSSFDGTIRIWDKSGIEQWCSKPYGRINIAGSKFSNCIFIDNEVKDLIIENGGIIE